MSDIADPADPADPAIPAADQAAEVPEKFRDPESGAPRLDTLLASYAELERKLAATVAVPGEDADAKAVARFRQALGVPDSPDGYEIDLGDENLAADEDVNRRLHEAGFTPAQAQLVYDLAREHVAPLIHDLGADFQAERQVERLAEHFGGAGRWRESARQISAWGRANLPDEVFEALSLSYEGVLAMDRMMRSGEPGLGRSGDDGDAAADAAELDSMMRDPRYWRDRDPAFVRRVSEGFGRLYPDAG